MKRSIVLIVTILSLMAISGVAGATPGGTINPLSSAGNQK